MTNTDSLENLRNYLNESATMTADSQLRNYVKTSRLALAGGGGPLSVDLAQAQSYIGKEVGLTTWFRVSQKRVNRFAEATGDFQFNQPDRASVLHENCYTGTIAHGMLVMSLLPTFATHGTLKIHGTRQNIIYGMDKVRFLNPVRIGSRLRGRFTLLSAMERGANEVLLRHSVVIEIEGESKPALMTDWLVVSLL